ncbi:MAG: hypothetical protein OEV28_07375, partial [Nitrospirota bacterium]|nr:hypothetical protein [Nitrospirota bacterium]
MMNLRETSHQPVFQLLSLVLVAICLYLPTLGFSFVWDDRSLILENWYIRDLGGIPGFFVSEFRLDPLISTNFYRPVVMSTYALDYFLWEENPMGFHLTNIILNTMVVLSVFLVARELLKGTVDYGLVPWVAALFFAVHPTHAESTAFIAGRTDLLAALFMLLAFWTYMRATSVPSERIRRLRYLGSLACFLLALFSKEVAIALLIILPLYEFYLRPSATTVIIGEQSSRRWMLLLPYLLVFAFYVVLRVFAVPPSLTFEHLSGSLFERFYPAGMALLQYIRMAFVPLGLKYYYFVELFKMTDPLFWISIGALIALTAGLFFVHRRAPLYVFCALWFLL